MSTEGRMWMPRSSRQIRSFIRAFTSCSTGRCVLDRLQSCPGALRVSLASRTGQQGFPEHQTGSSQRASWRLTTSSALRQWRLSPCTPTSSCTRSLKPTSRASTCQSSLVTRGPRSFLYSRRTPLWRQWLIGIAALREASSQGSELQA